MSKNTGVEPDQKFPVAETLAAIKEAQHPEKLPAFQNIDDLFDVLDEGDASSNAYNHIPEPGRFTSKRKKR